MKTLLRSAQVLFVSLYLHVRRIGT
jgi:hypothetical protein